MDSSSDRPTNYIGVYLGGAKGKTTALSWLQHTPNSPEATKCQVLFAKTRSPEESPWTDDVILAWLDKNFSSSSTVIGISAPLTLPSCVRCAEESCPGVTQCKVPSVDWLKNEAPLLIAANLKQGGYLAYKSSGSNDEIYDPSPKPIGNIAPYARRCTEVFHQFQGHRISKDHIGNATGPIATRGWHLTKQLRTRNYKLNQNLLEVSARGTIHAIFGEKTAAGYRKDADPWHTRAKILTHLESKIQFSSRSGFSKEKVLQNDHAFDALIAAYSAYQAKSEHWPYQDISPWKEDGWIWLPPPS